MDNEIIFKNRISAGRQLAEKLLVYKSEHPLILALPRGGVPVGYEVAGRLEAPLDTLVARKIGAPMNPEYGVGAIAPGLRHAGVSSGLAEAGGVVVFDDAALKSLGLKRKDLDPVIKKEMQEMERRILRYQSGAWRGDAPADTVIIVDDGLATGVTARAAVASAKITLKPKKIILAAPICARDTAERLRNLADEVICVGEVDDLMAIGYWYEEFLETSDEEVVSLLEQASAKNKKGIWSTI